MIRKNALRIISIISLGGMLFSGYLSYGELLAKTCLEGGVISCSASSSVGGIPVCVFGFFMYLFVFIISVWGLKSKE